MKNESNIIWQDWQKLNQAIDGKYSKIIVLTDSNVERYCMPDLLENLNQPIDFTISISAGELHKNLKSAQTIWHSLLQNHVDKKALLLCLGGGVVTDLGGFCASVFKRGISTIFIPTSLLGITDAALGNKTGLDFESNKNIIGTFYAPAQIFIAPLFLKTLPKKEWINGFAEILKHAIIDDAHLWKMIAENPEFNVTSIHEDILKKSISVKFRIVSEDPFENSVRKKLNFGHTVGHAIESFFLESGQEISHGLAVAAGMWIESYLNLSYGVLDITDFQKIINVIDYNFPKLNLREEFIEEILGYCQNDKKSEFGKLSITKIFTIGHSEPLLEVGLNEIREGLAAYIKQSTGR